MLIYYPLVLFVGLNRLLCNTFENDTTTPITYVICSEWLLICADIVIMVSAEVIYSLDMVGKK